MPYSIEHISEQLFNIIKGFGHDIVLFTDDGKKTVDPAEARRFYAKDIQMMVNLTDDNSSSEIVVNLSKGTDINDVSPMLKSIRTMAGRYIIEYTVKTFGKSIGPKDFAYQAKTVEESVIAEENDSRSIKAFLQTLPKFKRIKRSMSGNDIFYYSNGKKAYITGEQNEPVVVVVNTDGTKTQLHDFVRVKQMLGEARINYKIEGSNMRNRLPDSVNEGFSGWTGSARKSIQELDDARIVVRHKKSVDESKRGARSRQIESIFIENCDGERFKFPSKNLTAARAMLRHVKEGGTPFDEFGQYIYETMDELNELKKFQRHNKRNDFFEDAHISEEIQDRIGNLRTTLKQVAGVKGYPKHFESFSREKSDITPEKLDELKDNVTVRSFNEEISGSLPYVARVIEAFRTRQDREQEIVDFARYVMTNKDNIVLSRSLDNDDPDSPAGRQFKDPATAIAQWVDYIAPKLKDDALANKMMQISDTVFEVGQKPLNIVAAAINVIRKQAHVAESTEETQVAIDEEEMARIDETFSKYNLRDIFKV